MKLLSVPLLACLAGFAFILAAPPQSARAQAPGGVGTGGDPTAALREAYGKLPLSFEANHGQTAPSVQFLARGAGYSLFLAGNEAVFVLRRGEGGDPKSVSASQKSEIRNQKSIALRMNLVGANKVPAAEGLEEQAGKANYFTGNDPAKWQTNVPTFSRVHYKSIYPGIDLTYYGNQRQLEYDFVVAPNADPRQIKLDFKGASRVEIERSSGDLLLHTRLGVLREHQPQVYQERDGGRRQIASRYVRRGGEIGFEVGDYDAALPLVIDPTLSYSTYLGGSAYDYGSGIAVDSSGNAYITGQTLSSNFPTRNPLQASRGGTSDAFVTKLNPAGDGLVYSTYLGGSGFDAGGAIAVDSSGNAYVTGYTSSGDFPTRNAAQAGSRGFNDVFVTRLNAMGDGLVYSTYLGGTDYDYGYGIAADSSGNAYVTGATQSINFPTRNPFQANKSGSSNNAFVAKIDTSLSGAASLVYSTYLGGNGGDDSNSIAIDSSGNAYVTGKTGSTNFPTQNPFQASYLGGVEAFVTKLNSAGNGLVYSTYLGGTGVDQGNGIAVDSSGNAYVTGFTSSTNFPTHNPLQANFGGGSSDGFVTKLSATGNQLVYSTYLGGSGSDSGNGIAVDSLGGAYITGSVASTNFPTRNPLQGTLSGAGDAFITKLSAAGNQLVYSTYLGGTGSDVGYSIAVGSPGNAYITGQTSSTNFPTQNPAQAVFGGSFDAFIAKISPTPDLNVDLSAERSQVPVGDTFSVTATATNVTPDVLTAIAPLSALSWTGDGDVELVSGPTPAQVSSLDPAASTTFVWTVKAKKAGKLTFSVSFRAQHNGATVETDPASTGVVRILQRAADLLIKEADQPDSDLATNDIYLPGPAGRQLRQVSFEPKPGSAAAFVIEVQNDAAENATYVLTGFEGGDTGWKVQAMFGGVDQWPAIKGGGLSTGVMTPGASFRFTVTVTGADPNVALPFATKHAFTLSAESESDPNVALDAVGAEVETVQALVVNMTSDEPNAAADGDPPDVDLTKPGQQVTLRAAIQYANAHIGKDIIKFQIPADDAGFENGVWLIRPRTALPAITDHVTIDGWTQDPTSATPTVELDGSLVPRPQHIFADSGSLDAVYAYRLVWDGAASGLVLEATASGCEVQGLAVTRFPLFGIEIKGPSNLIQGCHVGIDAKGVTAKANGYPGAPAEGLSGSALWMKGAGIVVKAPFNQIGGISPRQRNLISGTGSALASASDEPFLPTSPPGLVIAGPSASGNIVEGNYFSSDVQGAKAPGLFPGTVPSSSYCDVDVVIYNAPSNRIGGLTQASANFFLGFAFSANGDGPGDGIQIIGGNSTGNLIAGNFLGTSASLSPLLLPKATAIFISNAPGNLIGGVEPNAGNFAVAAIGVWITGPAALSNRVINNTLDFTAISSQTLGDGVILDNGSSQSLVVGNSITFFFYGIDIRSSSGNFVQNNQINGNKSYGGDGIQVFNGDNNLIEANIIHDNHRIGVSIIGSLDGSSSRNRITANSIYNNGFGISLSRQSSPTPNDFGDSDTGSNGLQNYPVINRSVAAPGGFTSVGILSTNPGSRTYHLEFFANQTSPLGYGEGERLLGSVDTTTGLGGEATFSFGTTAAVLPGEFITATATDPDGNTSEFSRAVVAQSGNDQDRDGVSDEIENRVPNRVNGATQTSPKVQPRRSASDVASGFGDGNGDGVLDSQQNNVASLLSVTGKFLTLAAPSGVVLNDVQPSGPPDFNNLPAGYTFPVGFISFTATGVTPGGSVTISEIFHDTFSLTTVFAYGPTPDNTQPHWYEFRFDGTTGAQIGNGAIALTFVDGSRGDHDLQRNGQVTTILAPAAIGAHLLNISTRMRVLPDPNGAIGGFIITGTDSKRVIIRGIGPSLQSFGLQGLLADPVLELHKPDASIVTNDNWRDNQPDEILGTGIAPPKDAEAAIVATLPPGTYTAVLTGKNGGTGIGLVEVYDLSGASTNSQLSNISTRGFVDTGDNVMIGGFIIGGSTNTAIIVDARGPSIPMTTGTLADPNLSLHDGNGTLIAFNDDWQSDPGSSSIPASISSVYNAKDSALYLVLATGNYTAIVRGSSGSTGVALVEVYAP